MAKHGRTQADDKEKPAKRTRLTAAISADKVDSGGDESGSSATVQDVVEPQDNGESSDIDTSMQEKAADKGKKPMREARPLTPEPAQPKDDSGQAVGPVPPPPAVGTPSQPAAPTVAAQPATRIGHFNHNQMINSVTHPNIPDSVAARLNDLNARCYFPDKGTFSTRTLPKNDLFWPKARGSGLYDDTRWLHYQLNDTDKPRPVHLYIIAELMWGSIFEYGEPVDRPRIGFTPLLLDDALVLRDTITLYSTALEETGSNSLFWAGTIMKYANKAFDSPSKKTSTKRELKVYDATSRFNSTGAMPDYGAKNLCKGDIVMIHVRLRRWQTSAERETRPANGDYEWTNWHIDLSLQDISVLQARDGPALDDSVSAEFDG